MPTAATTHIQKIAPGPPSVRAIATPAMLPVPTRDASVMRISQSVLPSSGAGVTASTPGAPIAPTWLSMKLETPAPMALVIVSVNAPMKMPTPSRT